MNADRNLEVRRAILAALAATATSLEQLRALLAPAVDDIADETPSWLGVPDVVAQIADATSEQINVYWTFAYGDATAPDAPVEHLDLFRRQHLLPGTTKRRSPP